MKTQKTLAAFMLIALSAVFIPSTCQAQFFNHIKDKIKQTAEDHAVDDAGNVTNKVINKSEDKSSGNESRKSNSRNDNYSTPYGNTVSDFKGKNNNPSKSATVNPDIPTVATYKNYDFVPGDTVIFQSDLKDEYIGEIPSQFIVHEGQLDMQMQDSEKVIHIPKGAGAKFTARMAKKDYMPDHFTVEFDFKDESFGIEHLTVGFSNDGDGGGGSSDIIQEIYFYSGSAHWTTGGVDYPQGLKIDQPMTWHHVAIAVNKNVGKIYIDQYRVINVNNLKGRANAIYFDIGGYENSFIKNIRIAAGGIPLYRKRTTPAHIVMHGIRFDVGKATLKPESMGSINQIYHLMQRDPNVKYEIGGYTDNTGDAASNLKLSQARADAVKAQLVKMGISKSRLTTKGYGETKPISSNDTPEGKANNRRVEFVKI